MTATEKYAELAEAGEDRPLCDCHGLHMKWNMDARRRSGGRWSCWRPSKPPPESRECLICGTVFTPATRGTKMYCSSKCFHRAHRVKQNAGLRAAALQRRLAAGEQITNGQRHHEGMARWKEELGDPRPEGVTLSLLDPLSPHSYWGKDPRTGRPTRLSINPDDYKWEFTRDNTARNRCQDILLVKAGLLDADPETGEILYI